MDDIIKEQVKSFITTTFLVDFNNDADENTDLFRSGLVDSFGFVQLVTFLESTFEIKITDEDLVNDALTSVTKIVACVKGRKNATE